MSTTKTRVLLQLSKRAYFYTKYGELVSQAPKIQSKELYHPVLGKFISEVSNQPDALRKAELSEKYADVKHIPISGPDLMKCLRQHQLDSNPHSKFVRGSKDERITLGQVVLVQKKICMSKPQVQTFFGVVLEVQERGPNSAIRLRNVINGTGVEMLIPICSPLVEKIEILRKPNVVPQGPNLFGIRDFPEQMARFIDPQLLTDKGRIAFLKQLQASA